MGGDGERAEMGVERKRVESKRKEKRREVWGLN